MTIKSVSSAAVATATLMWFSLFATTADAAQYTGAGATTPPPVRYQQQQGRQSGYTTPAPLLQRPAVPLPDYSTWKTPVSPWLNGNGSYNASPQYGQPLTGAGSTNWR